MARCSECNGHSEWDRTRGEERIYHFSTCAAGKREKAEESKRKQAEYRQRQATLMERLDQLHQLRGKRNRRYYYTPKDKLRAYIEMVDQLIREEVTQPDRATVEDLTAGDHVS